MEKIKSCKGGCGKKAHYKGWCKVKWKKGTKICCSCSNPEKKIAKKISNFRIKEAKLGLNPMQNPEICAKNHSIIRNNKASLSLKKLGQLGLLPQQVESKKLKEKRRRKICLKLQKLAKEGKLNHQIESLEQKKARHKKISETMFQLARKHLLKIQNLTIEEKKIMGRKISKSLKIGVAEGRVKPNLKGFKTEYKTKNGELLILRSGWEAEVAKLLDQLNVEWEYEPFYVKYFNTEIKLMSNTLPDFYIPKQNLIIEVKGASISLPKTKDKIRGIKKQGHN